MDKRHATDAQTTFGFYSAQSKFQSTRLFFLSFSPRLQLFLYSEDFCEFIVAHFYRCASINVCVLRYNILHRSQWKNETSWTFEIEFNRCLCTFLFFITLKISLKSLSIHIKMPFNLISFTCCWQHLWTSLFHTVLSSFFLLSRINEAFGRTNYALCGWNVFYSINVWPISSAQAYIQC